MAGARKLNVAVKDRNASCKEQFAFDRQHPFTQHGLKQRGRQKKLEIDPLQAETVERIYRTALKGVDNRGPIGLKSIANWLN